MLLEATKRFLWSIAGQLDPHQGRPGPEVIANDDTALWNPESTIISSVLRSQYDLRKGCLENRVVRRLGFHAALSLVLYQE